MVGGIRCAPSFMAFTPSVMQQFGVKHGFKLAEQHPMPFDAFYVSMLTERYKGSRLSFLKGMWTGLLAWFSSLAKKNAVVQ